MYFLHVSHLEIKDVFFPGEPLGTQGKHTVQSFSHFISGSRQKKRRPVVRITRNITGNMFQRESHPLDQAWHCPPVTNFLTRTTSEEFTKFCVCRVKKFLGWQ